MCNYSPLPWYFLVPTPHFSARPMRFGSRGPSDLFFSRPYVSDTSPKSIDLEGLERRRGVKPWYSLFTPPPPSPRCVNLPWDDCNAYFERTRTVIPRRNWRQWIWKMQWGKQGYAYYGQCENGEFSPFNEKIWCLFCFLVYQIYAVK